MILREYQEGKLTRYTIMKVASTDFDFWARFRRFAKVPNVTQVYYTDGWGMVYFIERGEGPDPVARMSSRKEVLEFIMEAR